MIFYYTKRSPYARKVLLTAHALSCMDRLTLVEVNLMQKPQELLRANPIGRIPCLVDGDDVYYDSNVCCAFLESLYAQTRSVKIENLSALCDGLMDVSVDWFKETLRPDAMRSASQLTKYSQTVLNILSVLESKIASFPCELVPQSIGLVSALGYLRFRFSHIELSAYPNLNHWFSAMQAFDAVRDTTPL